METYAIFLKLCMTWKEQIEWQKGDVKNGDRWILSSWKGTMDSSAICPSCYDHSSRPSLQFRLISVRSSVGSEAFMVIQHTSHTSLTGDKWQRSRISQLDGMFFFFDIPQVKLLFTILGYPYSHVGYPYYAMWDETSILDVSWTSVEATSRPMSNADFRKFLLPWEPPVWREKADRNHRSDPRCWRLHQKAVERCHVGHVTKSFKKIQES